MSAREKTRNFVCCVKIVRRLSVKKKKKEECSQFIDHNNRSAWFNLLVYNKNASMFTNKAQTNKQSIELKSHEAHKSIVIIFKFFRFSVQISAKLFCLLSNNLGKYHFKVFCFTSEQ